MGPLWLDVAGCELTAEEREIIAHPTVGGVILFTRNYYDNQQLVALTQSIRKVANRPILIGVDQEGGRVQRFRDGFTFLPASQAYAQHDNGEELARMGGWLMASELIAHDIDLSFAPVLDIGFECKAIGSRSFGEDIESVVRYSGAFLQGMKTAGMVTTGKHFPGHGAVIEDSHLETPRDERSNVIELDMAVFDAHVKSNLLDAIMPAHVIYPNYDSQPASGSSYWLKEILREKVGFKGIIFSDDLSMEGASVMGSVVDRAHQSLAAGCDMILVCNAPDKAIEVLDNLPVMQIEPAVRMLKGAKFSLNELKATNRWKQVNQVLRSLSEL